MLRVAIVMVGVVLADVGAASACSLLCKVPGLPLPLEGASVPANATHFPYFEGLDFAQDVVLVRVDAAGDREIDANLASFDTLEVLEPLEPGTHRITLRTLCGFPERSVERAHTFLVESEARLPSALGVLRAGPPSSRRISLTASGSCSEAVEGVGVDLEIDLAPEAEPWQDLLVYSTWIDGEAYAPRDSVDPTPRETGELAGGSWVGRGRDLAFVACAETIQARPVLAEGMHRVKMRAELLGMDVVIETDEIEIELDCAAPHLPAPSSGCSASRPTGGALASLLVLVVIHGRVRSRGSRA
jgi:hypothetical protein